MRRMPFYRQWYDFERPDSIKVRPYALMLACLPSSILILGPRYDQIYIENTKILYEWLMKSHINNRFVNLIKKRGIITVKSSFKLKLEITGVKITIRILYTIIIFMLLVHSTPSLFTYSCRFINYYWARDIFRFLPWALLSLANDWNKNIHMDDKGYGVWYKYNNSSKFIYLHTHIMFILINDLMRFVCRYITFNSFNNNGNDDSGMTGGAKSASGTVLVLDNL